MWFNKPTEDVEEKKAFNEFKAEFDEIKRQIKIGDDIYYLSVKMLVIGYNSFVPGYFWYHESVRPKCIYIAGVNVEWMNSIGQIEKAFLSYNKLIIAGILKKNIKGDGKLCE